MYQKKTKIICTISDRRCSVDFIKQLYEEGMNIVRINSAHLSPEGAQRIVDNVRAVSDKIGILIDTKGPEVRLTQTDPAEGFPIGKQDIILIAGQTDRSCTKQVLHTNDATFVRNVPVGARILIDDGEISLTVIEKKDNTLVCRADNGGCIKGHKSINVPGVSLQLPSLSLRDREFIRWAIRADIDFIAHSFVRSSADLQPILEILEENKSHLKIISKIENQEGVENLDDILNDSYGVMVARGDLGVEIPAERIPLIQKEIVNKCRARKKPVIIATQMLHSMIEHPRPTRAEITDIANAIFERTDAIMLSGETASGAYPVESVRTMATVAKEVETEIPLSLEINMRKVTKPIAAVLSRSLVATTQILPIKAIIFDTQSGRTGRYLSEFRPKVPIYAMCYHGYTRRELALSFGVIPFPFAPQNSKEQFVKNACEQLAREGLLQKGDMVGIIGGNFEFSDNDRRESSASFIEIRTI